MTISETKPYLTIPAIAFALVGCGASGPPAPAPQDTSAQERPAHDPLPSRTLPEGARFHDLVTTARILSDRGAGDSEAQCVLGRSDGRYRLSADLAVAIRPLPEPPDDLDARLRDVERVLTLSRWGARGEDAALTLAAFTNHPPPNDGGVAIVLTDERIYLRPVEGPAPNIDTAGSVAEAVQALPEGVTRYVAAEADVSLEAISNLLEALSADSSGAGTPVVLATVLTATTRVPSQSAPPENGRGLCPEGLVAPDASGGAYRDPNSVMAVLGPMREQVARCVAEGRSPGGEMEIAFRIAEDGEVAEACAAVDETADPQLRACVLNALRSVHFPVPDDPGSVDLRLPLDLVAASDPPQAPLCPR